MCDTKERFKSRYWAPYQFAPWEIWYQDRMVWSRQTETADNNKNKGKKKLKKSMSDSSFPTASQVLRWIGTVGGPSSREN